MSWLQEGQIKWEVTCAMCDSVMEFIEVENCASKHKGPHPHVHCVNDLCLASSHRLGSIACVMVKLKPGGEA